MKHCRLQETCRLFENGIDRYSLNDQFARVHHPCQNWQYGSCIREVDNAELRC